MEEERGLYLAYESSQARMERVNTKLWVVILVLIVALIGTNSAWIWYESQYEDMVTSTQTVTQETEKSGTNSFVGGDNYGEADGDHNDN